MHSTMSDYPLTISHIFRHGQDCYGDSVVVTNHLDRLSRISFTDLAGRATQLAAGLRRLGVEPGDRVATFAWNNQEHQEVYFAVPCMGAVMHTVNIRLSAEQIRYTVGHAEDGVLIADASLGPVLAPIISDLPLRRLIVFGEGDRSLLPGAIEYEDLLAAERPAYNWPELEESAAAAMCYTSGTTDLPKGVVYSHRSTFLHSLGVCSGEALGMSQADRLLPVVPMFHGNAWGLPYAGWLVGADLLMPGQFIQAGPLAELIRSERATLSAAVPTVWYDMLGLDPADVDLTSLRMILCGGAAVPRSLIEAYEKRFGARIVQGWGLTETSPVASLAFPPKGASPEESIGYQATAGRVLGGVESRIVAEDGTVLPHDGQAVGEIEVRGPWVTSSYYKDPSHAKFHDGWLRTGDVGHMDAHGFITITDRAKDVIKSGGEWISSLELEAAIISHPAVREAAVIATPDERWGERPLAFICPEPGELVSPEDLRAHLSDLVVRWWLPEKWAFIDQVPRTSVGKYDKNLLRAHYSEGAIDVDRLRNSEVRELAMPEAVIAAIGRTPIGRAVKGSLIHQRPDDLGAFIVGEVLGRVPQLEFSQIDDVICGCALPGGEQSHNIARIISLLAGLGAPGTTVNRYCASSLQAVRMAFHAIKAGEGDVFVCAGVESSTRSPLGAFCDQPETQNSRLLEGNRRGPAVRVHEHGRDGGASRRRLRHQPRGDGQVRGAEPEQGRAGGQGRHLRRRDHSGSTRRWHGDDRR